MYDTQNYAYRRTVPAGISGYISVTMDNHVRHFNNTTERVMQRSIDAYAYLGLDIYVFCVTDTILLQMLTAHVCMKIVKCLHYCTKHIYYIEYYYYC